MDRHAFGWWTLCWAAAQLRIPVTMMKWDREGVPSWERAWTTKCLRGGCLGFDSRVIEMQPKGLPWRGLLKERGARIS